MLVRSLALAVAAAVAACQPGPSLAAPADPTVEIYSTSVRYSDLDLTSAAGRAVLMKRIRDGARQVCRAARLEPPVLWGTPVEKSADCERRAAEAAVARMNAPEVTAVYRSQTAEVSAR